MGMKKKTWKIYPELLQSGDVEFFQALGCSITIVKPRTYMLPGVNREVAMGSGIIFIETTCEKQELLLKLKFGDNLILDYEIF
jgi:hypothetical protein